MLSRRNLFALALAVAVTTPLAADEKPNDAIKPAQKNPERHQGFLRDIKKAEGKIGIVFLGDSITDGWRGAGKQEWDEHFGPFNPLNLGISGDRTQHVLWRLQNGELDGYKPKGFVIMIGTNNMGSNTPEEIAAGNKAIVEEIQKKHPEAKILLLGIFPRSPKAIDPVRAKIKKTNELLAKIAEDKKIKFLDIGPKFLAEDGSLTKEIMPDYLHLSKKGYHIWAEAIEEELEAMVK